MRENSELVIIYPDYCYYCYYYCDYYYCYYMLLLLKPIKSPFSYGFPIGFPMVYNIPPLNSPCPSLRHRLCQPRARTMAAMAWVQPDETPEMDVSTNTAGGWTMNIYIYISYKMMDFMNQLKWWVHLGNYYIPCQNICFSPRGTIRFTDRSMQHTCKTHFMTGVDVSGTCENNID